MQKNYLSFAAKKRWFFCDVYDIAALALLGYIGYRAIFTPVSEPQLLLFAALIGLLLALRVVVKRCESKRLAQKLAYRRGYSAFAAAMDEADSGRRQAILLDYFKRLGCKTTATTVWLDEEEYMLVSEPKDMLLLAYPRVLLVVNDYSYRDRRRLMDLPQEKIVLARQSDIYRAAYERGLVDSPVAMADTRYLHRRSVLLWGLLLLILAPFSRYFYLYFAAALFLLGIYLALEAKKTATAEVVLLKKAMLLPPNEV